MKFSANLGFLWNHLTLPERIQAAKAAGFEALECHFPYEHLATEIAQVLAKTQTRMLGINTALGPEGCFGVAALPGREVEAQAIIDQAIDYATKINAKHINVVAGLTGGARGAEQTYQENLRYACNEAAAQNLTIVIEPLNPRAVANYHVSTLDAALETIEAVAAPNLKIMFDFFHMQIVHGDLETRIRAHADHFGHVQFAAIHDRGEPDQGELNYPYLFQTLIDAGYDGYLGAEYKPRGESVETGLGWMDVYKNS